MKRFLSAVALLGVSAASFAEVPAVVGTTITAVQADALDVIDLAWPFVLTILGAFVLLKIAKRAFNKA